MGTVTLRDIPDALCNRVKELAAANRRSINSEYIYQLEKALLPQPFDVDKHIEELRQFRASIGSGGFDIDDIQKMIDEGRS